MTNKKDEEAKIRIDSEKFLYVGLGASAGGLDAFEKFLSNIPEKSGMAFIIVQHMDPNHKSGLVNILARFTKLKVQEIKDGLQVQPDNVYIIPPNKDIGMLEGKLQLMEPIEPHGLRMPINYFFTSLAQDQEDKSVGIIFSGFGSDGSIGLNAIKANGGLCIAQDPSTAGSDSMPNNAINTGHVDLVLAPEDMPEKLLTYKNSTNKIIKKILTPEDETTQTLMKIFILIRKKTGHDFSQYKKSTITRRIGRRMNIHQIEEISQYLRYLQENPNEIDQLYNEFLINVTNFFRDKEAFKSLKQIVLKNIIKEKSDLDTLRVWVPGCSSGEEVYSIAIIIHELLEETNKHLDVQIFGTDPDENSIKTARSGTYSDIIAKDISKKRLNKFFYKNENLYTIKNNIRDTAVFANHNVLKDPPFTNLDIISCRNLLIYLETEAQEKVFSKFNYALKKDGILFLGPSESIGEFLDSFSVIDKKWKLYKSIKPNGLVFQGKNHLFPIEKNSSTYWDYQFDRKKPEDREAGLNITTIAEKNMINIFTPPSAIINDEAEILYIHGRLGKFLEPSPGKANMNILEMARNGLKLGMRSAVQNAISNNKEAIFESLKVIDEFGKDHVVKLIVRPLNEPQTTKKLYLVSFEQASIQKERDDQIKLDPLTKSSERISTLETKLKITTQQLNNTIEEMTTSNEELKSANEELQSMNEESQSTNEELETSKEELQSINEELTTVNTELQLKIDELSMVNDDLTNLFNSTEIATIFVDNDINIRRFTEQATKLIKLIGSDVGRPLSDIVSRINYPDLVKDIQQVIEKVAFIEKEINTAEGEWYKIRIMPYKTSQNVIDGATITFINISVMKNIQEKMQSAINYAEDVINTVREPLIILDQQLKIISANKSFYKAFKLHKQLIEGEKLYKIGDDSWNIPSLRTILEDVLKNDVEMEDYKFEQNFPKIGNKKMLLNARRIYRGDIGTELILLAMESVQ
jgi:two-component system, chemotaxis family, CheB/CheR fusion protein